MLKIGTRNSIKCLRHEWKYNMRNRFDFLKSRYLSTQISPLLINNNLRIGDVVSGYEVKRIEEVAELSLTAYHLHHTQSGADHLHLARDDSNNVFGVAFRTTPTDSTGVAHILEHLALCGSEKYPCRDPFMKMLQRSLSTYMNALTASDYTLYPFSTLNHKDFENLMGIYLDAAFFPRLRNVDFRQEGWRLEHEDINDVNSPIVFKGVVFNEMKGVFSSPSNIFVRSLQNHLFPNNTYSHESGGDPIDIPNLTHQQLKEFHAKHYHPSNSRFFTYGNFPLESHLSFINDFILRRFKFDEQIKNLSVVVDQPKWTSPKKVSIECQPDNLAPFPEKQTTLTVAYVLDNITNTHECFTLSILNLLLTEGPNSPFYQSLIESGLGSSYSPYSGYSSDTKQGTFNIGLQNIEESDCQIVTSVIESTFKKCFKEGFSQERIEAILHRIELTTKHQSKNFGLNTIMNINPLWIHDGDPIVGLRVNDHVEHFRNQLKENPNYLKQKIEQYFIKNSHKLVLKMSPSDDFESKTLKKEQDLLAEKVSKLTEADKLQIYKNGLELNEIQQKSEDLSVLPTLNVKTDIPKSIKKIPIERLNIQGVPVQWCSPPTNGITYFHAISKISPHLLPPSLVPYLQIFCQVVTKLGAGNMDRKELDQEIQLRTGGLEVATHVAEDPSHCDSFENGLMFSSLCLERNIEHMFKLWTDIFTGVRFDDDDEYLMQLIKMCAAEQAMSVSNHGHRFAMLRAGAQVSIASQFRENISGLTSLSHFRKCASMPTTNATEIIANLKSIASLVFHTQGLRIAINAEPPTIRPSLQIIERFIDNIPKESDNNTKLNVNRKESKSQTLKEHHVFPFGVNYIGKATLCAQYNHEDYPKLKIASSLVSHKYLHREIREKGGAYGGGADLSRGGVFYNYSYRDPQVIPTIDAFNASIEWLLNDTNYSEQDIDEAKLSTFKDVDVPISPGEQGIEDFSQGITHDMKSKYRLRLLDVSKSDVVEVVKKYLVNANCGLSLIGPRNDATISDSNWKVIEEKPDD